MTRRQSVIFITLAILCLALFPVGLLIGGVAIPPADVWDIICNEVCAESAGMASFIVLDTRLPAMITAAAACAALAVAGILMQTCFNNPLAGPSIMGISSGASVGVAIVMMALGSYVGVWGSVAVIAGAFAGASGVLALLLAFSAVVRSADVLLIVGILIGYMASSAITLLNYFSTDQTVHAFVAWGFGTFSSVGPDKVRGFATICTILVLCSLLYIKSLNAMLFGQDFARSAGVAVGRTRTGVLFIAGALTAVTTAYCGPIAFVGLVAPHIARMLMATSNHRILLPATALCGAAIGMSCQILSAIPALTHVTSVPVNAITPIIGVPIIIYVMLNRRKLLYFN